VLLASILLKMGVYGFIRLAWPLFPDAAAEASPLLGALAVAGILYGALMALAQEDLKKRVAYSSVSHLGYCMLGLCSMRWAGALGGAFQMLSHAVTTGALFFMVGMLYERSHSRSLKDFGGLARKAPCFAVFLGLFVFASIGLPGLCGFAGEFPILAGAYQAHPLWAAAGVLGVLLGAIYLLGAYQSIAFGPLRSPHGHFPDLTVREVLVLLPLLLLALGLGVAPRSVMDRLQPGVAAVVREAPPAEPLR
jgi:NADH-quinone oxidoreductase subunit M